MKRQTDLTRKDLIDMAKKHFECLSFTHGRRNVISGGDWYVRLGTTKTGGPQLLLVLPIAMRNPVTGEWDHDEDITVVA